MKKEKGPRPEKVEEVAALREIFTTSKAAILADYRGLNVKHMSTLRKRLREADAGFRVVKNTLMKRAAQGLPAEKLVEGLEGPTGLAYSAGESAAVAKTLAGFIREFKVLSVKGGLADGYLMNAEQLQALALLPPRQVLLAQVVGGMHAPVSSYVNTLQQLYAQFVYTLQGVADKKEG